MFRMSSRPIDLARSRAVPIIAVNDIEICYEDFGPEGAPTALLIMGMGAQMTVWPTGFVSALLERGFRVIRFDNRDSGLSTKSVGDPPDVGAITAAAVAGEPVDAPYTLSTMAADAVGILDHFGIDQAHIVGQSFGGMIAQVVALEHRDRVLSLTSIFSMTGDPEVYQPDPEALATMFAPEPESREEAIAQSVAGSRVTHGSLFDEAEVTAVAIESYERGRHPLGSAFQTAAMAATGDRTERLRSLDVPTLVVHGREDPLVPLACGEHTAATIPGADLVVFSRMGHDIPKLHWPALADAIYNIAVRGEDR